VGLEVSKGGEVNKVVSEEQSNKLKTIAFGEGSSLEVHKEFPPKLKDPGSLPIACMIGNVSIIRDLCDHGSSVSFIPYSIF